MEILFFAVLSAFLFFKLWNILGIKQEKIIKNLNDEITFTSLSPLEKIRKFEPNFLESDFLESAKKAFLMIMKAYKSGDKEVLKNLLNTQIYEKIASSILEPNESVFEASDIKIFLQNIEFDSKSTATISVMISSVQSGDLIHDYWIFEKDFSDKKSYWKLFDMKVINA